MSSRSWQLPPWFRVSFLGVAMRFSASSPEKVGASDALRAAAVQLGPHALALAVKMNEGLGKPHSDVAAVLQHARWLRLEPS